MKIYNLTYKELRQIVLLAMSELESSNVLSDCYIDNTIADVLEELDIQTSKPKETGRLTEL